MKNSKRKIVYSLFALLIMLGVTLGVNATETRAIKNFNGTVNHNWGYVSIGDNVKDNTRNYSVVNWDTSSQAGAHNMWFRVVNSNGADRGSTLVPYLQRVEFATNAEYNHYYYLQARRENSVDPSTSVSGSWNT